MIRGRILTRSINCDKSSKWSGDLNGGFCFLMIRGRILTQDVLRKRGFQCQLGCHMCLDCPIESGLRLLFLCPYAVNVWWIVSSRLGVTLFKPGQTIEQIWHDSYKAFCQSCGESARRKGKFWCTWFICVTWGLWKHRNERIFRGNRVPPWILAERLLQEGQLWLGCC